MKVKYVFSELKKLTALRESLNLSDPALWYELDYEDSVAHNLDEFIVDISFLLRIKGIKVSKEQMKKELLEIEICNSVFFYRGLKVFIKHIG